MRAGEYDLKRSNKLGIKVATSYVHHNHNGQTLDNGRQGEGGRQHFLTADYSHCHTHSLTHFICRHRLAQTELTSGAERGNVSRLPAHHALRLG